MELVAPPDLAADKTYPLPEQMASSAPALITAIGLIVRTMTSATVVQGPAASGSPVVRVKVAVPAILSKAEGV